MIWQLASHTFTRSLNPDLIQSALASRQGQSEGVQDFQAFRGIFGHQSNELLTLVCSKDGTVTPDLEGGTPGSVETLTPTARPKAIPDLPQGGIYVLRWFVIKETDFENFVALSEEAWPSLEGAFDCKIMGLFRASEAEPGKIRMLLYTWYASLAVWEASRDQRPEAGASEAWKRFLQRQKMTEFTSATVVSRITLA